MLFFSQTSAETLDNQPQAMAVTAINSTVSAPQQQNYSQQNFQFVNQQQQVSCNFEDKSFAVTSPISLSSLLVHDAVTKCNYNDDDSAYPTTTTTKPADNRHTTTKSAIYESTGKLFFLNYFTPCLAACLTS
jgi:hypothetical protein